MIAARKDRKEPGPFRDLAEYIAEAKEAGEKLEDLWIVKARACETVDDLDTAIRVIDAQQALNTKVRTNKSYHLVLSFREKPPLEALKDIEKHFAEALGFADHPRVVGTHVNTDHFHMHIGYSRIHPKTLKAHSPKHDFAVLEKASRAMELKHGLAIDLGKADKLSANQLSREAREVEAHTWEQSFHGYVLEHKEPLLKALNKANGWKDLHDALAKYDLILKKRANGLVIGERKPEGKNKPRHIKASALDRSFSKTALEKRFGPFQEAARAPRKVKPTRTYQRSPITRHKGQNHLWKRYMGMHQKKSSLVKAAFKTWKQFLQYEALNDPLAMAIIMTQNKMIEALLGTGKSSPTRGSPRRPSWEGKPPTVKPTRERVYLSVPYQEREEAKEQGAKWDKGLKSWYAFENDLEKLAKWIPEPAPAPKLQEFTRATAEEIGAFTETAMTEEDALTSHERLDVERRHTRTRPAPDKAKDKGPELDR